MSQLKLNLDPPNSEKNNKSDDVKTPINVGSSDIQYGGTSDNVALLDSETESTNKCMRIYRVLVTMTIEPVVFCFMFGFIMNMSILTNLMMDVACKNHFNYSSEICSNLSGYTTEKKNVEVLATDFSLYSNLLSLLGAFAMIFIAPWSDKHGRKPPLLGAIVGHILTDIIFIVSLVYKTKLEYLVVANIPSQVFGGFICILTIIYSHASEVSTEKRRTLKYLTVELALGLGLSLGGLTGGILKKYTQHGYFYIYITVASLHAFCLVWVAFVVEETTGLGKVATLKEKAKSFFESKSLKSGFQATFKKRDGNNTALVLLLLLSMCVVILTYESLGNIGFVFVHHIYDWDATIYNYVMTVTTLSSIVIMIIIIPLLLKKFKLQDYSLGTIGAISMMSKNFLFAFAQYHVVVYYLGQVAGLLGQLSTLAIRTALSKIIEKEDLGKVFSFLATCEAVLPMICTIGVTKLFEATLDIYPNITYAVTALLLFIPIFTFGWAYVNSKRTYGQLTSKEEDMKEKA